MALARPRKCNYRWNSPRSDPSAFSARHETRLTKPEPQQRCPTAWFLDPSTGRRMVAPWDLALDHTGHQAVSGRAAINDRGDEVVVSLVLRGVVVAGRW